MYRSGNESATGNELGVAHRVDRDDGRVAQQSAKVNFIADSLARDRDDAHRGGLMVHHANGCFISNHTGDSRGRGITWKRDHVKANGADCSHGFKLVHRNCTGAYRIDHAFIFRDRDKGTRQTTNTGTCHHAALLNCIVKQRECRGGAMRSDFVQAHVLHDVRDRVTQLRGRSQRTVHDAKGHAETLCGHVAHQLASAGDLKRCLLDLFSNLIQGSARKVAQRAVNNAGARDSDGYDVIWLLNAVEGTSHERIITYGVG